MNEPFHPAKQSEHGPKTDAEKWVSTIFVGLLLGCFLAAFFVDFESKKLTAVIFVLAWGPLTLLHELGHAVVARLCGWQVSRLVIGFGPTWKKFAVGNTEVEIRSFPLEGFVSLHPLDLKMPRLKSTLIYAAGPMAELLLLTAAIFLIGPSTYFSATDSLPLLAAQATGLAIAIGSLINLVPHTILTASGQTWNDGMGIFFSWKLPDEAFTNQMNPGGK